jgi:hypothetical protein
MGFRPAELLDQIEAAYQGTIVAQTHRGAQIVDVVVVLDAESRREPEAIGALLVRGAGGSFLPAREVAEIEFSDGRDAILHEAGRRVSTRSSLAQRRNAPLRSARSCCGVPSAPLASCCCSALCRIHRVCWRSFWPTCRSRWQAEFGQYC